MKNKEKLLKMSTVELVDFLGFGPCNACSFSIENGRIGGNCNLRCKQGVIDWLNREVQENETNKSN